MLRIVIKQVTKKIMMQKHQILRKKYLITSGYRKFKSEIFDANIDKKELVNKSDISGIMNKEMETLGIKVELKVEQDKIFKL